MIRIKSKQNNINKTKKHIDLEINNRHRYLLKRLIRKMHRLIK